MSHSLDPQGFIKSYELALKSQDWVEVAPLFHDNACVTFSNGTIHRGITNIQAAYQHNFSMIQNEEYSMQQIRWIMKSPTAAAYTFEYYGQGIINAKRMKGEGIGTTVLIKEDGKWLILTENLNKKPD